MSSSILPHDNENNDKSHNILKLSENLSHHERILIVRKHFEKKGYRVHSGLQFGCELVLYANDPNHVHSDFCVHVVRQDTRLDWMNIQTLVRSMPDLHKTLIVANVCDKQQPLQDNDNDDDCHDSNDDIYKVEEIAISSEHAPFRHNKIVPTREVGKQIKKQKTSK